MTDVKREDASLLVILSFLQMACESNEHRGNAKHFRGDVRAMSETRTRLVRFIGGVKR